MIDRQGAVHEIPDDQVQAKYQSGEFGFLKGSSVPIVTKDGEVGHVDASEAPAAFDDEARVALPDELKHAERQAKYGTGVGNEAAAAAEGVARGLSIGLSDPLAIAAARYTMGHEAAESVREHLAGEKEANPWAAGVGEAAGTVVPLLIPGAQEVEAANLARTAGEGVEAAQAVTRAGELGKATGNVIARAGTLPRVISEGGLAAEKAISKIVGKEASGFVARTAQKVAAKAGGAAAEGAIYGLGNEFDEEALGDEDLNAEKMLIAAGHGALLAGAGAGVLTGAGELAREVAGRSSPLIKKLAGWQAWKAANPGKALSEKALVRAGGVAAVGNTALEHGVLDGVSSVEDLYANAERAVAKQGKVVGAAYEASNATVERAAAEKIFDDEITPLRKKALHGDVVASLEKAKADFLEKMFPPVEVPAETRLASRFLTPEETKALVAESGGSLNPDFLKAKGLEFSPDMRLRTLPGPESVPTPPVQPTTAKIGALIEQRQAIQDKAYKEAKALDVGGRVEHLRNIAGKLSDLENTAMDEANRLVGQGPTKVELEKMRKDYQRLSLYKEALQKSNAKYATNRNLSISDYMIGIGGMLSGHPSAALAALGHKVLRERGNAWAARGLDKLAAFGAIERASSSVDRDIERGIADVLTPGERAKPRLRVHTFTGERKPEQGYEQRVNAVAKATTYSEDHAQHVGNVASTIAQHAPNTAAGFQQKALGVTAYLASKIPQGQVPQQNLLPTAQKPKVSDFQKAQFVRQFDLAHDPVGSTFDRMSKGMLTKGDADALKAMYPRTYDQISESFRVRLQNHPSEIPFDKRMQIGTLLGIPSDAVVTQEFTTALQQNFGPDADRVEGASPERGSPKRAIKQPATDAKLAGR